MYVRSNHILVIHSPGTDLSERAIEILFIVHSMREYFLVIQQPPVFSPRVQYEYSTCQTQNVTESENVIERQLP